MNTTRPPLPRGTAPPPPIRASVLVVDDDPAARASLEGLLAEDYDVETVSGALVAEATLDRGSFDVVITDHQMPGMSGLQLLADVARKHPSVVGILVTGHAGAPEVQAAKHNWRDFTVVLKPYDPTTLLRVVRSAVGIAHLRRATDRLKERHS